VITGNSVTAHDGRVRPVQGDMELIESRTLDGSILELIYRPTLHV
jgi:hypothetical protein